MKIIDKSGNISEVADSKVKLDFNRIILFVLTIFYLGFAFYKSGWEGIVRMLLFLIIPFCCIWFPKPMGAMKGFALSWPRTVTKETPAVLMLFAGWFFILFSHSYCFIMN